MVVDIATMDVRKNCVTEISSSFGIVDTDATAVERGIYNRAIDICEKKGIVPAYNHGPFLDIYTSCAIRVLTHGATFISRNPDTPLHAIAWVSPQALCPERWRDIVEMEDKKLESMGDSDKQGVILEGVFTCKKCKSRKIRWYQKQTRSADEPMTNFYECVDVKCGAHWRN